MKNKTKFLKQLFSKLENLNISYCILHKYQDLTNSQGDIDIAISKKGYKNIKKILKQTCKKTGWNLFNTWNHEPSATTFILAKIINQKLLVLQLDFCYDYRKHLITFIKEKELLENRKKYSYFYIASEKTTKKYLFFKRRLKKQIKDPKFKKTNYILNNLFSFGINLLQEIQRKIKRILNPDGKFIALIGPDRTGKTSTSLELKKSLSQGFRKIKIFHTRPNLLPTLSAKPTINPHSESQYNPVISFLKLIYLILDYNLGYLFKILPLKICSTLIIFDRYSYDLIADKKRFRINLPKYILKIFHKLIKKPDITFYIQPTFEQIKKRGLEISENEVIKQLKKYNKLTKGKKFCVIKALTPKENSSEIIKKLLQKRENEK